MSRIHKLETASMMLAAALLAVPACQTEEKRGATVEKIKEQPRAYEGRTVTVKGEIDEIRGPRAFKIEAGGWLGLGQDELLVLTKSPIQMPSRTIEDGADVVVTGKVRTLVIAEVERELGWDLDQKLEAEFRDKPVLIAQRVTRVDELASWTEGREPEIVGFAVIATYQPLAELAGTKVSFDNVPVRSVAEKGLWVGYAHTNQLLIVPSKTDQLSGIQAGDMVQVKGKLEKMPPADEAIKRFGLSQQLRGQIAQEPLYLDATELSKAKRQPEQRQATPQEPQSTPGQNNNQPKQQQ